MNRYKYQTKNILIRFFKGLFLFTIIFAITSLFAYNYIIFSFNSSAATSSAPLSISHGGTGTKSLTNDGVITTSNSANLNTLSIDQYPVENSQNPILSQGAANAYAQFVDRNTIITINSNWEFYSATSPTIAKIGKFYILTGAIKSKIDINPDTSNALFTIRTGLYNSRGDHSAGSCSALSLLNLSTAHFDCMKKNNYGYLQSDSALPAGQEIGIYFIWTTD
ncbi:MAG: hypothetical protein LBT91_01900 [Bifidobacteriaceae bacterium]|jgi:hypothetical protein|nr:hypothetical protein [Bifidobacteriaceae bacterium]